MFLDARTLRDLSILRTDVCIVGAGPAGITLARELDAGGVDVCLVESGGLDPVTSEALPLATLDGDIQPTEVTRGHGFGGTARRWNYPLPRHGTGVGYGPLRAIDFEERDWVPHSGWPFRRTDLDPYYSRAHEVCGLPPYEAGCDEHGPADLDAPLSGKRLTAAVLPIGNPRRFTHVYREEFRRSSGVTVLLNATALELEQHPSSGAVQRVRVGTPNRTMHSVQASTFVLAGGGIENPRLLLLSTGRSATGIGNAHDLVGRYFFDHAFVQVGVIVPNSRELFDAAGAYSLRRELGGLVQTKLTLTEATLREHQLLTSAALLMPKPSAKVLTGLAALKRASREVRRGRIRDALGAVRTGLPAMRYVFTTGVALATHQQRLIPSLHSGWGGLGGRADRFETLGVELQVELVPDHENRVLLSDMLDPWGRPAAGVRWRWTEVDRANIERTTAVLDEELRRSGVGRFERATERRYDRVGAHHHMGSTRMHTDPVRGVVDANLRVHGVDNLFVAGSSVFPTGGHVNPTLTIVALSIRLADHLKRLREVRQVADPHQIVHPSTVMSP